MLLYGDWDGTTPLADAAKAALSPHIRSVEEMVDEFIALADKYVRGQPPPEVNIEQAAVMKLMTDVYLCP